ncbi:MAG: PEP-CTERM sorting domain-containing protein [Phycisphaerae bacterium]
METRKTWRTWTLRLAGCLALGALLASGPPAGAGVISGTGTADLVQTGDYAGWYKYTYEVTWNLSKGLRHLDLVLKPGCTQDDHHIVFETELGGAYDGESTGEGWDPGNPVVFTVSYEGMFEPNGDPSIPLTAPLIKWEPYDLGDEPGKTGVGQFWFYANILPEYSTFDNVVVAKSGQNKVFGDMTGAYPSCQVIPEPATAVLLLGGLGLTVLSERRRRA